MSAPARKLAPNRRPDRQRPGVPGRAGVFSPLRRPKGAEGAKRPLRRQARPATPPRRRKKHQLGFALFASLLVGLMVLGIVVLNVLLAQRSFRIDEAERRIETLGGDRLELVRQQATLSAPGRIAEWASRHGMRLPDDIRILRAPNGPAAPAGADLSTGGGGDR